ncbi:MAG: 6-carboxytetrahydropterin synthase [Chloroflexota bacterium]
MKRDFIAQHFLVGGDWGPENEKHSHHYQVEVQLEGARLDEHGYLMDIVDIEANLEDLVAYYSDHTLNELPEFEVRNPSIEHFSRIFCQMLSKRIQTPNVSVISVKIWENDLTWASYREER